MHIFILGSTGRTGRHILRQALQRGHHVNVLVRDRNKIGISHPNLATFEGSILDKPALESAMNGCEAIVSALNVSRNSDWPWSKLRSPEDILSQTMKNIIELAPKRGIQRIIFTSAWGVAETKKDIPGWFRWFIDHSNLRYPYCDHERQEELIRNTPLQWTSVRLAGLTNSKKKKQIIVSLHNDPKPRLTISRSDAATFMLDALERSLYLREMPAVSSK